MALGIIGGCPSLPLSLPLPVVVVLCVMDCMSVSPSMSRALEVTVADYGAPRLLGNGRTECNVGVGDFRRGANETGGSIGDGCAGASPGSIPPVMRKYYLSWLYCSLPTQEDAHEMGDRCKDGGQVESTGR